MFVETKNKKSDYITYSKKKIIYRHTKLYKYKYIKKTY